MNRRQFVRLLAAFGSIPLAGCSLAAKRRRGARVVVIGAGFGGATAARYLRLLAPEIEVIVIEREKELVTGPFSNAVIAGLQHIDSIRHDPKRLTGLGIEVVYSEVVQIRPDYKTVELRDGTHIAFDRLILSPGIDFSWNAIPGYDEAASKRMPHAWRGRQQFERLQQQLHAMDNGGVVLIAVPAEPYRCPPGPYERASLIAAYLKRYKPRSKILVLDAKERFTKQELFQEGWNTLYPGMIEWIPVGDGGRVIAVNSQTDTVITENREFKADVTNIIPPQRSGQIARDAGLADSSGWCPVNPYTFESTLAAGIHILGDSAIAGSMPKSGHAANAQGKVCAEAVIAALREELIGSPSLINTCYSLLDRNYAISVTQVYHVERNELVPSSTGGGVSPLNMPADYRRREADHARSWYKSIMRDSLG